MTLISAFIREDGAVLLGDALVTSGAPDYLDHELPTIGLPNEHKSLKDIKIFVSGMCRKIVPITDQTYLLISGAMAELEKPLKSLVSLCPNGFCSDRSLMDLSVESGLEKAKFRGMLLSCDGNGYAYKNLSMHMQEHWRERRIFTAGSGRDSFNKNYLKNYRKKRHDPFEAISKAITMCSSMMLSQDRNGYGLSEGYGGFFEAVASGQGMFEPINNILYIVRNYWFDKNEIYNYIVKERYETNGIFHNVDLMIYVSYVGDNICVIRWLSNLPPRICFVPSPTQHRFIPLPDHLPQVDWVVETLVYATGNPVQHLIKSGPIARQDYSVSISETDCSAKIPQLLCEAAVDSINKMHHRTV